MPQNSRIESDVNGNVVVLDKNGNPFVVFDGTSRRVIAPTAVYSPLTQSQIDALPDGSYWVEIGGVTPNRTRSLKVKDGSQTFTLASVAS